MGSRVEWIAFFMVLIFFVVCFCLMLYRVALVYNCRHLVEAECVSIVHVVTMRYKRSLFKVKFRYRYKGIEYVCNCLDLLTKNKVTGYVAGETYKVYIDSNNPRQICINNKMSLIDSVTLIGLAVLVVMGIILLC